MFGLVLAFARAALDVAAPPVCPACSAPVARASPFCAACAADALPIRACGADGVYAAFAYGGPVAVAIRRAKYPGDPCVASGLGRAMRFAAPAGIEGVVADLVVPVPLSRERLAERGFNQATPIARAVAAGLGAKAAPTAMRRLSSVRSQASQNASGRRAILDDNPFRVSAAVRGLRVVVCDDVVTTGSTLGACAAALRDAGAACVTGVVLARVAAPSQIG